MSLPDHASAPATPARAPAGVQRLHRADVLGNRLAIEHRWGRPCLSYFVCIRPDAAARDGLSSIQDAVGAQESLLRVPPEALHVSVAWLLPVQQEFARPKAELWAEHGPEWLVFLAETLGRLPVFRLSFTSLVATDSAVIAVAAAPNQAGVLRQRIVAGLQVPWRMSTGELVHTTLFRYRAELADPRSFLRRVGEIEVDVDLSVAEVLVVREPLFPSLANEVVHRFTLPPA